MAPFRLGHGLPDFGAAVGAFIDEVDCRHAPVGLDLSDEHRHESNAAGADDWRSLNFVMLDVGWHVGSPSSGSTEISTPSQFTRAGSMRMINSCERKWNSRTILAPVALR
jgi:hypothetical protein